jgi:serine/threonine protein kinase
VAFTVENICGLLIRSRLMTPDEMRAMYQRWQDKAGGETSQLPAFLRWLVASGYVTEYQASLLSQGHADNFFLNQYKILERIGRGRMAGVFKAVHQLGQVVAIKVLPPSRAKNAQLLSRFEREARLALKLKHPNVVRSFQVGDADGLHFLVMEHLEGETLDDVLRRRKTLPPAEAVALVHQTLLGLEHLHQQGMVHRDLKPANLFLQEVGSGELGVGIEDKRPHSPLPQVKILDIGLARELFDETAPVTPDGATELTAEGMLLGTPDYLAPEQARDPRRSDIRADIYSVGCVLYHMLTGQTPFPDQNLFNQIVRHATETPRPLREFNAAIPEGLEQIVAWMMAKQPEKRYPTPARAAAALEAFLLIGSAPEAAPQEAPQMRRYLTWLEMGDAQDVIQTATFAAPPMPAAAVVAAVVPPATVPVAALPTVTLPAAAVPVAAAALPRAEAVKPARPVAVPPSPDEIDVELVSPDELPAPEPVIAARPAARTNKTALIIGIVVAALLVPCGCAGIVFLVVKRFMG